MKISIYIPGAIQEYVATIIKKLIVLGGKKIFGT